MLFDHARLGRAEIRALGKLNDSKQQTPEARAALYPVILRVAARVVVVSRCAQGIDARGLHVTGLLEQLRLGLPEEDAKSPQHADQAQQEDRDRDHQELHQALAVLGARAGGYRRDAEPCSSQPTDSSGTRNGYLAAFGSGGLARWLILPSGGAQGGGVLAAAAAGPIASRQAGWPYTAWQPERRQRGKLGLEEFCPAKQPASRAKIT